VDLHLISFVARILDICGGEVEEIDVSEIEVTIGSGFKIGLKLRVFKIRSPEDSEQLFNFLRTRNISKLVEISILTG
jgi:hypothetical protein